ncbi:MAG TPA: hypothetical protein VM451_09460 [Candidatus Limnocylindria bacterium]|nr:hypothetical protein [Candidatus Limnocylindria bacterium]
MPRSTVTWCVGCDERIAIEEPAAEFYHREQIDLPNETHIDVRPDYVHADHAELAKFRGRMATGRTGVLGELQDLPWPPKKA